MTDLVARLTAALDETERIAQQTLNGPFEGMRAGGYTDHHESPPAQGTIVRISMLPISWAEGLAPHIYIAYDPASVLRMVAARRKILALHRPAYQPIRRGTPPSQSRCVACLTDRYGYSDDWEPDPWPCPTLLALAEACGIEA